MKFLKNKLGLNFDSLNFENLNYDKLNYDFLNYIFLRSGLLLSMSGLLSGLIFNNTDLIFFGLWVLVLLPAFRVIILLFNFLKQKESVMAICSIIVLAVMALSFYLNREI